MNFLICLLGLSPGVVTGAYYALARDRGITIDRLVTVGTSTGLSDACERMIVRELKLSAELYPDLPRPYYDDDLTEPLALLPRFHPPQDLAGYRACIKAALQTDFYGKQRAIPWCRLRIPDEDVTDEASATALREVLLVLVRDLYPQDDVYLCTAGGRKSMAAIAMLAAQLGPGVRRLFHVHNDEDRAEADGSVESTNWPTDEDSKKLRPILRPEPDKLRLVDIPFFRIRLEATGPELFVPVTADTDGRIDEFVLEIVQQYEDKDWVVLDPKAEEELITAFFEERVRDWLENMGYEARRQPTGEWLSRHGIEAPLSRNLDKVSGQRRRNDIDVAGVKGDEVVIVECKSYLSQTTVKEKDLNQTLHLLNTRLTRPELRLKVWLATVAQDLYDPDHWAKAGMDRIEIWSAAPEVANAIQSASRGRKWRPLHRILSGQLHMHRLQRPGT